MSTHAARDESESNEHVTLVNLAQAIGAALAVGDRADIRVADYVTAQYVVDLTRKHPATFCHLLAQAERREGGTAPEVRELYAVDDGTGGRIVYSAAGH